MMGDSTLESFKLRGLVASHGVVNGHIWFTAHQAGIKIFESSLIFPYLLFYITLKGDQMHMDATSEYTCIYMEKQVHLSLIFTGDTLLVASVLQVPIPETAGKTARMRKVIQNLNFLR